MKSKTHIVKFFFVLLLCSSLGFAQGTYPPALGITPGLRDTVLSGERHSKPHTNPHRNNTSISDPIEDFEEQAIIAEKKRKKR